MIPRRSVAWSVGVLREPLGALRETVSRPVEETIGRYLTLLVASGLLAGITSLVWAFVRAYYLDVVRDVTVDYWRLLNYYGQVVMGTAFLYVFFGTFVVFLVTVLVQRLAPDAKYVRVVAVTCAATAPILVFGWIAYRAIPALGIWSVFLLMTGVRILREKEGIVTTGTGSSKPRVTAKAAVRNGLRRRS